MKVEYYIQDASDRNVYYFYKGDKKHYDKMAKDKGSPNVLFISKDEFTNIFGTTYITSEFIHKETSDIIEWGKLYKPN